MSSQQQLLDLIVALNSTKKMEKLNGLEKLIELLNQDEVVKRLVKSSKSEENDLNWDILFLKVHNAALSLVEGSCAKSRQVCNKRIQIMNSVICQVVQKSVFGRCLLISPNLLASKVLAVFKSDVRVKNLGFIYLHIFNKYILSEKNWYSLKPEYWIGMKDTCKEYFKNPPQGINPLLFLQILIEIIRFSSKNCQISHHFLDLFPFLRDVYISSKKSGSDFENTLLHLTNTLCLHLAIEFRYKVCEFMESVFGYIKNYHKQKSPHKNILIYHFFKTSLNIHNPNGLVDKKTTYACNLGKWKSQIREIFYICYDEINSILKNSSNKEMEIDLLLLFVDVSHLVTEYSFDNGLEIENNDVTFCKPGPSNKRKCSAEAFGRSNSQAKHIKLDFSLSNLLSNLGGSDCWFWLKFLELLITKYPHSLKNDYCQLVEFLFKLICEKKNAENAKVGISFGVISRCLSSLLDLENLFLRELTASDIQWLDDMWNKISAELIRSLFAETNLETHTLIRSLIRQFRLQDIEPLIKLYCNGTLQPGIETFKTLCTICQHCIVPETLVSERGCRSKEENHGGVREHLLNWLLGEEKFPCNDLAKVLVALLLKKFEEDITISNPKDSAIISQINIDDFCELITHCYLTVAFENLNFVGDSSGVESSFEIRIESAVKKKLFDLLELKSKCLVDALYKEDLDFGQKLKALEDCWWFVELMCHLLSYFECSSDDCTDCTNLTSILKSTLSACSARTLNLMKVNVFDLSCISRLYSLSIHHKVQKKIRQPDFISMELLQLAFELFEDCSVKTEDPMDHLDEQLKSVSRFSQLMKNPKSILHFQSLSGKEKLMVSLVEMLCQYITLPGSLDSNYYQSVLTLKIMKHLTCAKLANTNSDFYVQLVLRVVYSFTEYDAISVTSLGDCLDLMQMVFNKKASDFEVIITALQVFKELACLVQKAGNADTNRKCKKILEDLADFIVISKSCGVKAACKFIECLAEVAKVNLEGNCEPTSLSSRSVLEKLITFLKHPYHEVRLTAARYIGLLFVHNENTKDSTRAWQKKLLRDLFEVLSDSEGVVGTAEECVLGYHRCITTSISLISWAGVICLGNYWRKKALFRLIHLAYLKKFPADVVKDIMKVICRQLKIDEMKYIFLNFPYLFYKWTKKGLQIQDFPFYLLRYETVDKFLQNHIPTFLTAYVALGQLDSIKALSLRVEKTIVWLLKDFHSELLAFTLPTLNENETTKVSDEKWKDEKTKNAEKLKHFINEEVPSEKSFQMLTENLDQVIFNMMKNMHDPQYLLSLCDFRGNLKDDQNPLGFRGAEIVKTLKSMGKEGKLLLGNLALEEPSVIEKVLRGLLKDVVTAVIYEEKVFAFYKYIFFVEVIGKSTSSGLVYRNINAFFVRDVACSLAAILRKTEDEILTDMACECFRKLGDSYLEEFSSVLGEFLPVIATALTPGIKRGNAKAMQVLSFFIIENYSKLEPHIALMDVFPPEEIFCEINKKIMKSQVHVKDLKDTIKHFIRVGRSKNSGCRAVGLRNLCQFLSEKKLELKEMYGELKLLRGFSEDCKSSLLHQLICMLVELTSDENTNIRFEAAKCLGELGPSDLTTLVLKPENNFTVSKIDVRAMHRLLRTAVGILFDLLVSDSYEVKEASSRALYAISSTAQGREIIWGSEETLENVEYLTPFESKSSSSLRMDINTGTFLRKFGRREVWRPCSHEKWVVKLTETLLESFVDCSGITDAFLQLSRVNWQFAENIFPACLDFVLSFNDRNCKEVISTNISSFFEENFNYKEKSSTTVNKPSVQCILNVIDYIRVQRNHERSRRGFDLSTNFLNVAKAALYCSAFFTSIFYAELWFEDKRREMQAQKLLYVDINTICELFPEEGVALAEILRECHFEIGNLDGIHGCGYMHILNSSSEIQHYEHSENWGLSMLYHDVEICQGNSTSEIGLLQSLERLGMCHTLSRLTKTHFDAPESTAILYRCAARLHDWSRLDSTYKRKNNLSCDSFDKCYYFALKAFHDEDEATFQNESRRARNSVLGELAHCSLESSKNFYLLVTNLQRLKELEEFASVLRGSCAGELRRLFGKWDGQDGIKCGEFKLVESILANRTTMIRDAWERERDCERKDCLGAMLCRLHYKLTVAARKEKKYEAAIRTLSYFDSVDSFDSETEELAGKMKVEKARILWERGHREIGRFLLNHFLKKKEIGGELKMKSLRLYGDWMAKTKWENSREIIENYYLKSIAQCTESHKRIHSYASLANFAHGIYEQFNEYLSSPLFETKQNLINTQQDMASVLRQELDRNQTREKRMAYQIAEKQRAIDENEIKNSKAERDSYLALALKFYLLSLREGEKYNLVVFRVVSLWLSNPNNSKVIRELRKILNDIPTYKFLGLLPQLIPRMADVPLISDLLERTLQEHPHHTLPPLFALRNSYEDLKYCGGEAPVGSPRVSAACSMITKFESNKKLERLIHEMHRFSGALIELANYGCLDKCKSGSPVSFPKHLQIRQLANMTSVAVPSISVPYSKNCVYDDVIGIRGFEQQYHLVGGINLPKRITCIGTDGVKRALLVKGRDDLRQDAVMQQVFTVMNTLLYQNKETSRRKLVIRTYKVVPLSQRSGVIEWCENTQSLSLYLTGPDGKSGAHKTYYPEDASAFDCRCKIRNVFAQPRVTNEEKLKAFMDACQQLHPVFHNFFIEKFPAAGVWFERRLAYIRSVATSSMIGYILGIGDRHVHNILIDNATAEVIHIDLGIAFEQGRTLPTPETVPFRLTRDIVDGMGLAGVEGDFRISCTNTMEVLRENQGTILTLLEVLLYDPLHTWTVTPERAYSIQNRTEASSTTKKSSTELETNKMAERVLLRLKQKLQGLESGFGGTTVEGQVGILINEARDPSNLSRLYHGWQAYL